MIDIYFVFIDFVGAACLNVVCVCICGWKDINATLQSNADERINNQSKAIQPQRQIAKQTRNLKHKNSNRQTKTMNTYVCFSNLSSWLEEHNFAIKHQRTHKYSIIKYPTTKTNETTAKLNVQKLRPPKIITMGSSCIFCFYWYCRILSGGWIYFFMLVVFFCILSLWVETKQKTSANTLKAQQP